MGKYTFTWEHAAQEVYVTGTFDDWKKTVKLEKENGVFKKTVELPKTHTQYKFVVDGNWCTNGSAREEDDGHGIVNNVLQPGDIADEPVSTLSSAAPQSTTAALAGGVPKESEKSRSSDSIPGAFPETPAVETPGSEPRTFSINPLPATAGLGNPIKLAPGEPVPDSSTFTDNTVHSSVKHDKEPEEASSFGVAPLPATAGLGNPIHLAPGEKVPHPSTFTDNTIHSTVKHDKQPEEASTFGVAPFPATAGAGNPIHLAPGEKVPHPSTFTSNTVQSTAKTDPSSYSKSDALPALPELALTPQAERDAKGGMFGLPPITGGLIPESSLPMGVAAKTETDTGYTIQSAAPTSTTAALAGAVPKEPRIVPETVTASQKDAGVSPEASANSEAVLEKKEVEQELKEKVPEAPAAADNSYASNIGSNVNAAAATAFAGATAGAGLFAAAIYSAKDKTAEAVGLNGSATTKDVKDKTAEVVGLNGSATASDVPAVVTQSQKEAHVSPEAAGNPEAVREKSQFEQELLSEVPKTTEHGLPAPAIAIPAVVSESQKEAHVSPEAASNREAVAEKKAVESELLSKLPKTDETGESAPVFAPAVVPGSKSETPASNVPYVVTESQKEAHASPEAAANSEVVAEKKAVESELLKEIPRANEAGEPAPVLTAATSATAPGQKTFLNYQTETVAHDVPAVVAESQKEAHISPEAAANTEAVTEKKAVETELLKEIKATHATGEPAPSTAAVTSSKAAGLSDEALVDSKPLSSSSEPDVLNAPASAPAKPLTSKPIDSNTNVSFAKAEPSTTEQTKPTVTTGAETSTTEATSSHVLETPKKDARKDSDVSPKGTPGSQSLASAADDKKKKRRSIFGKIKDKLSSKH